MTPQKLTKEKLHDLGYFKIWTYRGTYDVYSPTDRLATFPSLEKALEFIATYPFPIRGDRAPIRNGRNAAEKLLCDMINQLFADLEKRLTD